MLRPNRKNRPSREEKAALNRQSLIDSAAVCIGEYGYNDASIAKIADGAGLAHGTFYNYFEDRQDLFDQLLPIKGLDILAYIRRELREATSFIEMERLGLLAFQSYVQINPWFFRLLHEGRFATPKGHAIHMDNLFQPFVRALKRWQSKGELKGFTEGQLESLAYLMIGARDYLFVRSTAKGTVFKPLEKAQLEAYLELLRSGVLLKEAEAAASQETIKTT
ncbi:TetR/AcrR family transcriptional regulator [uncultured Sneathiella sp.]|uniref:TetR/AcrR family transcriptional regulator n=1 Tax=uncultured Sneathiella sp. TaxID=879315 RepID=UPI0030EC523A|tara:strand:- start:32391 stop:33053 length:663 start_codon:yes stop_codon:yes gene_type:complete